MLAYFAADGHATRAAPRDDQKSWLLACLATVWAQFVEKFAELWEDQGTDGDAYPAELFGLEAIAGSAARSIAQQRFFAEIWDETVGFAGAVIIRRLVGIAHVADMEEIENQDTRAACERRALKFGRRLLVGGAAVFNDVKSIVQSALAVS